MDLPDKDRYPLSHAKWIKDATEATKQAAEVAKSYPELDCRDWEVPRDDRAVSFHEKNSSNGGSLQDAIVNAMRYHLPPDEIREMEAAVQRRDFERRIALLNAELKDAKTQVEMWRAMALKRSEADGDD